MGARSDFLFARPSFLSGVASLLDFGGTQIEFNQSLTPEQADRIALMMDWRVIGNDLRSAMQIVAAEAHVAQADGR